MKKEDKIIHSSIIATSLYDERLSPYATKNSQCM